MNLQFTLNGVETNLAAAPDTFLVDLLRDAGHTGTKEACGVGVCGVCTVLVNDRPVSSCTYLVPNIEGADVWTVEGLTTRDVRLLEAFVEQEGMQCGICTPGQVVSAFALRQDNPNATEGEIRAFMAGNLCRCTGYVSIVDSIKAYLAAE